jgi:hypothetical protein
LESLDIGGNPIAEKKLLKLSQSTTQAKDILKLLRGGSKSKSKAMARAQPRDAPPRLYQAPTESKTEPGASSQAEGDPEPRGSKKGKGKPRKKGGGDGGDGAAQPISTPSPKRMVLVDRAALSVRPHLCFALLHVVRMGGDGEIKQEAPYFFGAEEGCLKKGSAHADRFEVTILPLAYLPPPQLYPRRVWRCWKTAPVRARSPQSVKEVTLPYKPPSKPLRGRPRPQRRLPKSYQARFRMRGFIDAQTAIHHEPSLGDKRRAGALGSHNASVLHGRWPLRFSARPHAEEPPHPMLDNSPTP